jgi:hypothetical protein
MKIHFNFDATQKIFYKQYTGEVTYNDFESSWLHAIHNKFFPPDTKGFLLDYREATFAFSLNETYRISDFFQEHFLIFSNKKIAFIASTPEQIIIPILLREYDFNYQSRPFSTIEAAESWILG